MDRVRANVEVLYRVLTEMRKSRPTNEGFVPSVKKEASVVVSKDGPYIVSGDVTLTQQVIVAEGSRDSVRWQERDTHQHTEKFALCRCGHSNTPPFCDGTHAKIGFDGTETAARTSLPRRRRPSTVRHFRFWMRGTCAPTGGFAIRTARYGIKSPIPTTRRCDCPAGRLVAFDKATGETVEPQLRVSIALVEDPVQECSGPIWLRGDIPLTSADGYRYEVRNRVTLCRCGASKNKPFCDGTHASIGFQTKARTDLQR